MKPSLIRKVCTVLLLRKLRGLRGKKRNRKMYSRPLFLTRDTEGEALLLKHLDEDIFYHHKYYRMNSESLELLMQAVGPKLQATNNHRVPITTKQRLVITLRYLATGNSQISLAFSHRTSPSAVCAMLPEVLSALVHSLKPKYIPTPTIEIWKRIATEFWKKWNLPSCCGAVDGKHARIVCPANSGSQFYNYKKYFSIVLMAIADARYRLTYVDIGAYGAEGDSTIFNKCSLVQAIETRAIELPKPVPFPGETEPEIPHVFVADDAFPLKEYIMRPFKPSKGSRLAHNQKVFNYRLSRARRVVENSFGILAAKFRYFHRPIHAKPDTCDLIISACCCLHNFLIDQQGLKPELLDRECRGEVTEGEWRAETVSDTGLVSVSRLGSNNYNIRSKSIREEFTKFLVSEYGSLPWQDAHVNKGI